MLSMRQESLKRNRRKALEQLIIDGELDYPNAMEDIGFTLYRLGTRKDHLFLMDLTDPIAMTGAAVTARYRLPFDLTLTKIVFYQTDAAGAESNDALDLRLDLMHPNETPEVIYNKGGVSWPAGGERITGITYMPASALEVIHNGTATNLLYMSLEVVVHNIA